jgi:hypothetical protein
MMTDLTARCQGTAGLLPDVNPVGGAYIVVRWAVQDEGMRRDNCRWHRVDRGREQPELYGPPMITSAGRWASVNRSSALSFSSSVASSQRMTSISARRSSRLPRSRSPNADRPAAHRSAEVTELEAPHPAPASAPQRAARVCLAPHHGPARCPPLAPGRDWIKRARRRHDCSRSVLSALYCKPSFA